MQFKMSFPVNKKKKCYIPYRITELSEPVSSSLRCVKGHRFRSLPLKPQPVQCRIRAKEFLCSVAHCLSGCYIIREGVTSARLTLLADRNCARRIILEYSE